MCNHENREAAMVVLSEGVWCDPCLASLVKALNDAGIPTIASCCGHGTHASSVALADGRWLLVVDDATFRAMDIRLSVHTKHEADFCDTCDVALHLHDGPDSCELAESRAHMHELVAKAERPSRREWSY